MISEVLAADVCFLKNFRLDVRELLHHLLKDIFLEAKGVKFSSSLVCVEALALEQDIVLSDHVANLVDTIGVYVDHISFDIKEDFARLLTSFKDQVVLVKTHRLELL